MFKIEWGYSLSFWERKRGVMKDCGRRICSYCKIDLGPAPGLEPGELTHGACPECYARVMQELDGLEAKNETD